ncbi:hypothetical protein BC937DRAFT_87875 [Endogone sp. FLAS-F59071]|nr:hypothetical protein BC937DRAFT_87875 [Endogone sp. FLAS-F59071]|eukprot:RUS22676.1 hypothetical protein BC937DRAFT_87875 [Endogone sp. FLAS-F59071]
MQSTAHSESSPLLRLFAAIANVLVDSSDEIADGRRLVEVRREHSHTLISASKPQPRIPTFFYFQIMSKFQSGDALGDDFDLDATIVDNDDVVSDDNIADDEVVHRSPKKRKTTEEAPKKKKQKKSHTAEKIDIATLDRGRQYEHVWEAQRKAIASLTTMELEEQRVSEEAFLNTQPFSSPHTLENLASFNKQYNFIRFVGVSSYKAKLLKKPANESQKGMPVVLVLTSSAIRAVDLIRAVSEFQKQTKVAKLFAKHLKMEEQVVFLKNTLVNVAVGTPSRILKLLEETDALKLDRLELVVIDCEKDKKQFTIFDLLDVRTDLFKFLGNHFKEKAAVGARLALY